MQNDVCGKEQSDVTGIASACVDLQGGRHAFVLTA